MKRFVFAPGCALFLYKPRLVEKLHAYLEKGTCCGDTFYPALPATQVIERMRAKGGEMPRDEVLVYCVSCSKSMFVAGKRPRYLVDLLFAEETVPGTTAPEAWHRQLDEFIAGHTGEK